MSRCSGDRSFSDFAEAGNRGLKEAAGSLHPRPRWIMQSVNSFLGFEYARPMRDLVKLLALSPTSPGMSWPGLPSTNASS